MNQKPAFPFLYKINESRNGHLKQYFTLLVISNSIIEELSRRRSKLISVELNAQRNTCQISEIMKVWNDVLLLSQSLQMNLLLYYVWTIERYPIEQAVIVMKNFLCSKPKCSILYLCVSQKKKIVRANPYCFSFKTNWKWMQLCFNIVLAPMPIKKPQMKFWTFILAFLLRLFCSPSKPWVCCKIHLPSLILNVTTLIQANSCMWIQSWCHLWTSNLAYGFNNLFFSAWQI